MKRIFCLVVVFLLFCGCSGKNSYLDRALSIRQRILQAEGCSFDAVITADYGDKLHIFTLNCHVNKQGDLDFEVIEPESISGIAGTISEENGKLKFDDKVLAFSTLADGQIVPVCAPWVFISSLRSGYLNACGKYEDGLEMIVDDSYQEDALQLNIKTDASDNPINAEILWKGRRILSLNINNFSIV